MNGLTRATMLALALAGVWCLPGTGKAAPAWQERLNYQGQLTDPSGNAVADGQYDMRFRIYNAAGGGLLLWGPETFNGANTVTVNKGLFNVILGSAGLPIALSPAAQAADKWLSIEVWNPGLPGWDGEMSPRQPLLGSLFARNAESVQGTLPNNLANNLVVLDGSGKIPAGLVQGSSVSIPLDLSGNGGIYNLRTVNTNGGNTSYGSKHGGYNGVYGTALFTDGKGVVGDTYIPDNAAAAGVSGWAQAGKGVVGQAAGGIGVLAAAGTGTGLSATTASITNYAVYGDGARYGAMFKTGDNVLGVAVEAQGPGSGYARLIDKTNNAQVYGHANGASNYGVWGNNTVSGTGVYGTAGGGGGFGVHGNNTALTGNGYGVYGTSASNSGAAIYGLATSASGVVWGVVGKSSSASGQGVYGENTSSTGSDAYGVHGKTASGWSWSAGVWGEGPSAGVKGSSPNFAGYFESPYTGVYARATQSAGTTYGIQSEAYGSSGAAGYFYASGNGANAISAYNYVANGDTGYFYAGGSGNTNAIHAFGSGAGGSAIWAENWGGSPGYGIAATGYGGGITATARSAGSGVYGTGIYSGVHGASVSNNSAGVRGEASGSNSPGVLGKTNVYSYQSPGVAGEGLYLGVSGVSSAGGYGVYGYGSTGVYGDGGSYGVQGNSSGYVGVYGFGPSYGVQGYGGTYGVYGSGSTYGVYGYSAGNYGVYGSGNYGVYADGNSIGVYIAPVTSYGLYYNAAPSPMNGTYGVRVTNSCGNCYAGYFYNSSATASSGGGYALYTYGRSYFGPITGSFVASGSSYVLNNAYMDSSDELLLTPKTDPGTSRWYVSAITTGSATITFNPALAVSTTFSYFIIGD